MTSAHGERGGWNMGFDWTWFWLAVVICMIIGYAFVIMEALATEKYRRALWMAIIAALMFCIAVGFAVGGMTHV